tara:strand:- start:225 stop:647 length:423 start_codon:yes stop_codon:yes gene_type:complete
MPKYKEEVAKIYTRAEMIVINNPLPSSGLNKSMRFNEETAVIHDDGTVTSQAGVPDSWLSQELTAENQTEKFDLVDSDDKVTGTATFAEVHAMLRSLYKYVAKKRDDAPPPADDPVPLPEGVESVLDMNSSETEESGGGE